MKRSSIGQWVRGGLSFVLAGRTRAAWRRDAGPGARVVRGLAGCAGGWQPRRGSILVIVLGTLALLSVLTLVYVSQGRSDTRGSAIVVERDEVRRTARDVGDYLASLVANDALATTIDPASPPDGSNMLVLRETMDAPFTDPQARSYVPPSGSGETDPVVKFDPVGDHRDGKSRDGTAIDVSSLRPRPSDPWLASSEPTQLDTSINAPRRFEEMRDWAHISNIAPDGRFVNLFALRNNFFAKPGRNLTPAASEPLRMGDAVWLFNDNGARPNPGTNPATMNSPLPLGAPGNADRNVPAHWDSYQRHGYRPMRDLQYGPGDPRHLSYSWADTDGDGLADARWQELVDTSDPDNPTSILSTDGPFRWFVAARIVDLSGRVNVNTATEFRKYAAGNDTGEPTIEAPTGVTPAEVDLRRLLMLTDVYKDAALGSSVDDRGYKSLLQPTPANLSDDYTQMTEALAADFGRAAYNALKAAILLGRVPPRAADMLDESLTEIAPYGSEQRIEEYIKSRAHALSAGYYAEQTENVFEVGGLPDLTDLTELLTYNGVNNPATLSRLEQIMGGRADASGSNNGGEPADNRLSPLRDNRGLAVERDASALQITTGAELGMASDFALLRQWIDVRSKLTTISGARPLTPRVFPASTGASAVSTLSAPDVRIDAVAAMQGNGQQLFKGYAEALLPYAGLVGDPMWDNASPQATLSYGHDARLALRVAAHLAANGVDLADRDPKTATPTTDEFEPKKFTVRTGDDIASAQVGTPPFDGTFLDLGDGKFEKNNNTAEPVAMNIWGIEPQPFLTEVASFYVYWDVPQSKDPNADLEDDPIPGNPDPPITIKLDLVNDNHDLLMQALVFQLNNPFDVPLKLADGTATPMFYIEIGDKHYDIADIDPATGSRKAVELDPGQTMNFYVLCDKYATLKARWETPGKMDKFIATQMSYTKAGSGNFPSGFVAPKLMRDVAPGNDGSVDLLGDENKSRDIKLKRVSGNPTSYSEHLVIDRLNDPEATSTLKRVVGSPSDEVSGTKGGLEGDPSNDNTGYMIALWGRVKRHDLDSSSLNDKDKRGFLPPWCVEARSGVGRAITGMAKPFQNWAKVDPVGGATASLEKKHFVSDSGSETDPSGRTDFGEFVQDFAPIVTPNPQADSVILRSIRTEPKDKHLINNSDEAMPPNASLKNFGDLLVEIPRIDHQFRVADPNNNSGIKDESNLRLVDLLAPLGIGPEQNPGATDPDEEWLTLGEALACALDYSSPQPTSSFKAWSRVGADNGTLFPKLDRGNLVLDDYVPYVNADGTPGFIDGQTANSDRRAGTGVPMALTIMDKFHVAGASYGGLTKATPGLVNLNTATLNVLRTLPVLTPTTVQVPSNEWWGGTTMPNTGDRAAALIAYRDRTQVKSRADQFIRFDDTSGINVFDPLAWDGRLQTAQIEALREQTGLASVGELMAIVDNSAGGNRVPDDDVFDALATETGTGVDSTLPGVATSAYRDPTSTTPNVATAGNELINEWAEKLAVLGPAAGSASVRSDYYACWFVMHGYREADCLNLSNDKGDPLVPTIAKRYLMVIDRSNVTQRGQKPRVLVFTELPMQ